MREQKIKYGSNSFGESRLKIPIFHKFHFWPFFLIAISRFSWFTSFSNRMSVMDMVSFEIFFHVTNSGELGCSNVWTKSKIQVERVRREQFENKIFPIFWQFFDRNFQISMIYLIFKHNERHGYDLFWNFFPHHK